MQHEIMPKRTHGRPRNWLWSAATVLLIVLLLSHPELRLLLPLLDAIGLDVLVLLLGFQLSAVLASTLWPGLIIVWRKLTPLVRWLHRVSASVFPFSFVREFIRYAIFHWLGASGPTLWWWLHRHLRLARLGPYRHLQPSSLSPTA